MDYVVIWNKLPLKRLLQHHNYIKYEKGEALHAERFVDNILKFADKIAKSPEAHPPISELSNKRFTYRGATYKRSYKVIYRIDEDKKIVVVTNLFHNKRDPKRMKK